MNYKKEKHKVRFLHCHCSPLGQTGCRDTDGMKGPTFRWHQMNKTTTGAENLLHHLQPSPSPTTKATTPKDWLIWHGLQIITVKITLLSFPSLHFKNKMRSVCKQVTKPRWGDGLTENRMHTHADVAGIETYYTLWGIITTCLSHQGIFYLGVLCSWCFEVFT